MQALKNRHKLGGAGLDGSLLSETIAGTADGFDHGGVLFEFFSQAHHDDVNASFGDGVAVSVDGIHDLAA